MDISGKMYHKLRARLVRAARVMWDFARAKPLGAVAAVIFFLMLLIAIIGPFITPYDPLSTAVMERLQSPNPEHWFGTDHLGRDILSRLIAGTQTALLIAVTASFVGTTLGMLIGIFSGYIGGRFDLILQRFMDMIMAFPTLILAVAIVAVLGSSIPNVIIAIAVPMIPRANRIGRSVAMTVREFTFIEAARSVGVKEIRIIFRHVLPNCTAAYLIILTSALGMSILAEASLSFLGLGIAAPHPAWGRELYESMRYFYASPWTAIFPGLMISLAVFGANLFGDALRDIWDPRLKRL